MRGGIEQLRKTLAHAAGDDEETSLTSGLVKPGDSVLLVMPQDPQAPKGRLILPQVQTIRDLLNKSCIVTCCGVDTLEKSLNVMKEPPALIITDSQVFSQVYSLKPEGTLLTSFSVLMAATKGNIEVLIEGAKAIDNLTPQSRVLIAEACTHAPMSEDIAPGRCSPSPRHAPWGWQTPGQNYNPSASPSAPGPVPCPVR